MPLFSAESRATKKRVKEARKNRNNPRFMCRMAAQEMSILRIYSADGISMHARLACFAWDVQLKLGYPGWRVYDAIVYALYRHRYSY